MWCGNFQSLIISLSPNNHIHEKALSCLMAFYYSDIQLSCLYTNETFQEDLPCYAFAVRDLPATRMSNAMRDAPTITAAKGPAECDLTRLIPMEARPPKDICKAPSREDALPAFLVKGAMVSAEVLGAIKPRHDRYMKMNAMIWKIFKW